MHSLKRKLVAAATILVLLVPALPAMAHTFPSGHSICEGTFGFDHGIVSDGSGYYHKRIRYINTAGFYTVIRRVYKYDGPKGVYIWNHDHVYNYCDEGPYKHPLRPPGT